MPKVHGEYIPPLCFTEEWQAMGYVTLNCPKCGRFVSHAHARFEFSVGLDDMVNYCSGVCKIHGKQEWTE